MDSINNLHPKMQAYSPFPMAQTNYYTPLFGQNSYAQNPFAYENNNYNQYQTQNNFQKYEFLARDVFIQGLNLSQDNLYSAMIVLLPNRPNMNNNNYQAHQMLNDSLFQQYVAQECIKTQKFYQNNINKFNNINCENLMQNQMKEQQQQQYQKDINYNQLQNSLQNNNNINAQRKVSSTVENDSNNQQQIQKNDAKLQKNKNLVETKKAKKQIKVKQEDGQQTESNEDIYEISEYSHSSTTKTIINTALNQNNSNSNLQLIQSQQINEQKNMPKQESSDEQVIHESFDTDCTNQTQSHILKNDINQQKVQISDNDINVNENNNINNNDSNKDNKTNNEANNLNQFGSFLNNIQNLQGQYQNLLGNNNLNINHIDILQQIGLEEPVDDMNNSQSGKKRKSKFDTKNLVKNFLNSFYSFIQSQEEEAFIVQQMGYENKEPVIQIRNQLKEFFKGKKFNRDLLKEFMFESIFRPHFLLYLEKRAPEWIEKGRMKDKASHWRALKNYTFVCTNYEKIKSWRFRYNFV